MAHILVADDDAAFRSFLGTILQDAGHTVGFASNGEQAVDFFNRGGFDIALVDLVLPRKNGVQVIREIVAADRDARVVAISGQEPEELDRAQEAGALRTLIKPVTADSVMQTIAVLLRRSTGWQGVHD